MKTSAIITRVLTRAATHHRPHIDPVSLLDVHQARTDNLRRAHTNAVIAHHLHHVLHLPVCIIARAYKLDSSTIHYRLRKAATLIQSEPWASLLKKLP